jgi:hypothetical protein
MYCSVIGRRVASRAYNCPLRSSIQAHIWASNLCIRWLFDIVHEGASDRFYVCEVKAQEVHVRDAAHVPGEQDLWRQLQPSRLLV